MPIIPDKSIDKRKPVKSSDGKFLTEEQVLRNLKNNMQRDDSVVEQRYHRANISILGNVRDATKTIAGGRFAQAGNRTVGFAQIKQAESAGFAQNNQENKPSSSSYDSLKGQKPVGL